MTPAPVGLRCPEHSGKPQGIRKVTAPTERAVTGVGTPARNAVTIVLIGINVAHLPRSSSHGRHANGTGNWIFNHGALFANGVIFDGQLYGVRGTPGAGLRS